MQSKNDQGYFPSAPPAYSSVPPTVQVHTQSSYPNAPQPTYPPMVTQQPVHTVNFQPPTVIHTMARKLE